MFDPFIGELSSFYATHKTINHVHHNVYVISIGLNVAQKEYNCDNVLYFGPIWVIPVFVSTTLFKDIELQYPLWLHVTKTIGS